MIDAAPFLAAMAVVWTAALAGAVCDDLASGPYDDYSGPGFIAGIVAGTPVALAAYALTAMLRDIRKSLKST